MALSYTLDGPNANTITIANGGRSETITLYGLAEPVKIPYPVRDMQITEHPTRRGPGGAAGFSTFAVAPVTINRASVSFTAPYLTPAQVVQIEGWREDIPPTCQITVNGTVWYLAILTVFAPDDYPLNQQVFFKAEMTFRILGIMP